ncbi:MBL fold metallo-hydrolase [Mucilaginibacter gotjawali]|uniref:mRNA 3-end processing factor n=2 Tax=Mucilaginibacter gotjawali TaxID=1550579 RepID=A0A839SK34_9SPHI|nr:MBL fold metallo-hydrolase [Mucilaginibacter gotjawali]MBB3057624.1 putative mRNA 3-end processing factor [Mucilaginibacter gotjawali]BAU55287.1 Beta-lactamase superfamily domain protein [Mucilaginibacter gotjawali]
MNIREDFVYFDTNGLYCKYGDFYIDPILPVKNAVISHAHADHAKSNNHMVYCTAATYGFMQLRYGKNAAVKSHIIAYDQSFFVGNVKITLVPAGHMLGSAQVLMEYEGVKYLYTGDYKLQPDNTCEPLEWVKTDVLITESTFANPEITHPDPVSEIKKLNEIKINILLGAYGLGKSQRLISMINQYAPQKKILVHYKIAPINAIYEKMGFPPGKCEHYSRKLMKNQEEFVYIVPPFTFDAYIRATGVKRLFASGWKNLQANEQDTLFISDHVDWNDILLTIKQTDPQQIWTLHGNGQYLKKQFGNDIFVKLL